MKENASINVRRILAVVDHWAFGSTQPTECVAALEHILRS
jgi:hypothetical protein